MLQRKFYSPKATLKVYRYKYIVKNLFPQREKVQLHSKNVPLQRRIKIQRNIILFQPVHHTSLYYLFYL